MFNVQNREKFINEFSEKHKSVFSQELESQPFSFFVKFYLGVAIEIVNCHGKGMSFVMLIYYN